MVTGVETLITIAMDQQDLCRGEVSDWAIRDGVLAPDRLDVRWHSEAIETAVLVQPTQTLLPLTGWGLFGPRS